MVTILPSAISWAMPRPAVIKIMVATMGCTFSLATKKPFQAPHKAPTARAMATAARVFPPKPGRMRISTMEQASAPEMAMTEPTEMSVPPVASTMVMPMASTM